MRSFLNSNLLLKVVSIYFLLEAAFGTSASASGDFTAPRTASTTHERKLPPLSGDIQSRRNGSLPPSKTLTLVGAGSVENTVKSYLVDGYSVARHSTHMLTGGATS